MENGAASCTALAGALPPDRIVAGPTDIVSPYDANPKPSPSGEYLAARAAVVVDFLRDDGLSEP
jgi:hypothetical protein